MGKFQRIISIILIPAIILFMVYLPKYAEQELGRNRYREWMEPKKEDYSGIITVWHVVGFRPYLGSLGSWLKDRAKTVEKQHFGVYLSVEAITVEEAEQRIESGAFPDVISFHAGWCDESRLMPLGDEQIEEISDHVDISGGILNSVIYAVPYAASCRLILYDPTKKTPAEIEKEPALYIDSSLEDFKAGKAACCIADARAAGDLSRALLAGKAEFFETMTFENETSLVQYLGISSECEKEKLPYILDFFNVSVGEKAQLSLCDLGLMPLNGKVAWKYEQPILDDAYMLIKENSNGIASAFGGVASAE